METIDVAIIGAGAVGLAVAARLSKTYPSCIVFERHDSFGQETAESSIMCARQCPAL